MAKKPGKATKKRKAVKSTKTGVNKTSQKNIATASVAPRHLKQPENKLLKLARRTKHPIRLPSAWNLAKASAQVLWQYRKLFIGITLVYGLLNLVLVQGLASSTDVGSLKTTLNSAFSGHLGALGSSL